MTRTALRLGISATLILTSSVCAESRRPEDLTKLPLAFEPNRGQGDRVAQYLARGAGYTLGIHAGGASVQLLGKAGRQNRIGIRFAGASAAARAVPLESLPGKVNYFIGADPKNWRSDIPTYGKIEYAGVYPGVDVTYYGNQRRLEFDFRIRPGADPAAIRIAFDGPQRPVVDPNGDLVMGELRQRKPVAYQMLNGERRPVECRYVLGGNRVVRLAVGAYDRRRSLVIDPVLSYATYLGGSLNDAVASVKVDSSGNLYVAGFTSSINFPIRGAAQSAYAGTNSPLEQAQFGDAFVAKLNPSGTAMIYATYLGGKGDDFSTSLAIDASGNAYVVGATQSSDFPTTAGVIQKTYSGFTPADDNGFYNPGDGFVAKLNPAGDQLLYSTYLGGSLNDLALGVAVDSNGNAVVGGSTESSDFPTTANALAKTFRGNANQGPSVAGDGFVSVLNPTGTALVYSTFLGGRSRDGVRGVAVDAQNNIYVCGLTFSGDFPVTPGAYQTTFKGLETNSNYNGAAGDGFVAKLSSQGSLVYATYLGGGFRDVAVAIAVDSTGAVYVTGNTSSTDFPTTANAPQKTYQGTGAYGTVGDSYFGDAFAAKLNPAGSALVYSTYLGGKGDEGGLDIAVDSAGDAFVVGYTTSPEFPVTADALQQTNAGLGGQGFAANPSQGFDTERVRNTGDAFLTKLSPTGALAYSSFFGGDKDDGATAVAVDGAGNAYVGGGTLSQGLATSSGGLQPAFGGAGAQWPRGDGFIAKFDFGGKLPATPAKVNVVTGFTSTGAAGAALPAPFTVEVLDATGAPVAGIQVAFTATGATVNPASAVTDSTGRASTTVTLGATAGAGSVTATVAGVPAATTGLTINAVAVGPTITAVVNGASFLSSIAPGSWITVYIDQTASASSIAQDRPLPTILSGYRIRVNGSPIPIYAVTPLASGTQLNAQLPYETASGSAQFTVEVNAVQSAAFPSTVQDSAPGIFVFGDNRAIVQNVAPDQSVTLNTADNPAPAGGYIIAYLTGQGALDNPVPTGGLAPTTVLSVPKLPYSATLGGTPVTVAFLGMTPGQIGLAQANILVPKDFTPGTYPLVITIGTAKSNGPMVTTTTPRP